MSPLKTELYGLSLNPQNLDNDWCILGSPLMPVRQHDIIQCLVSFFFFLVFLPFLGLLPQHMEVPRIGVKLEL